MKTLIKNILLAVPVILSASCSSWLEEEPKTFISPSAFYQTVEDFDGALKGLYPQDQNLNLTEVFADYNDINDDTRMQIELINQTIAELQAKDKDETKHRNPIGFNTYKK